MIFCSTTTFCRPNKTKKVSSYNQFHDIDIGLPVAQRSTCSPPKESSAQPFWGPGPGNFKGFKVGVSKNRGGPPKWMVKIMENPIKIHDLGVPLFLETPRSKLS